jgi:hypothetical protein
MSNYNIMIYIYEDDKSLRSSFYNDLSDLLIAKNKIPINIMYHSHYFFGSMMISIDGDKYIGKKIETIPCKYKYLKKDMTKFFKKNYKKGLKNIFIYGGHSHYIFKDPNLSLKTDIFEEFHDIELLILDMCYGSYTNMLTTLVGKVNYVLCCETPGPYRGYMGGDFLKILLKKGNDVKKYKLMVDNFIARNSAKSLMEKKVNYRTDGVLISMEKYKMIIPIINELNSRDKLNKDKKCKIEDLYNYHFYDVICVLNDKEKEDKINECILYWKMNKLNKEHYNGKGKDLNGLSIGYK